MKKIITSVIVIAAFAAYVIWASIKPSDATPVTAPTAGGTSASHETTRPVTSGSSTGSSGTVSGALKDGTYKGKVADAFYGPLQVTAVIQGGKLVDVQFNQYPNDRGTSLQISNNSLPQLKTEAIKAQNAQVNIISGATQTSEGFQQSLQSALDQARA